MLASARSASCAELLPSDAIRYEHTPHMAADDLDVAALVSLLANLSADERKVVTLAIEDIAVELPGGAAGEARRLHELHVSALAAGAPASCCAGLASTVGAAASRCRGASFAALVARRPGPTRQRAFTTS